MAVAQYANVVTVRKLAEEFILDFVLKHGEKNHESELVARIVLSPAHAGRLGEMLTKLAGEPNTPGEPKAEESLSAWPREN